MKWPVKRIEHEKAFCKRFVEQLGKLRTWGKTKHLWYFDWRHIANEREGNRQHQYALMGVHKGDGDYQFIWATHEEIRNIKPTVLGGFMVHIGWIEAKYYPGQKRHSEVTQAEREKLLTPEQLLFREFCLRAGINHEISLDEGEMLDTLIRWGALLP